MTALSESNSRSRSFRIAHEHGSQPPVKHRIETPDYSVSIRLADRASQMLTGLLGEASVELGEQLSLQPSSTSQPRDEW